MGSPSSPLINFRTNKQAGKFKKQLNQDLSPIRRRKSLLFPQSDTICNNCLIQYASQRLDCKASPTVALAFLKFSNYCQRKLNLDIWSKNISVEYKTQSQAPIADSQEHLKVGEKVQIRTLEGNVQALVIGIWFLEGKHEVVELHNVVEKGPNHCLSTKSTFRMISQVSGRTRLKISQVYFEASSQSIIGVEDSEISQTPLSKSNMLPPQKSSLIGRIDQIEQVLDFLTSFKENRRIVYLCGMPGTGKTAVCSQALSELPERSSLVFES